MSIAIAQSFTADERQKYIGCSEFGAVCGLDKYKTPLDVYNLKRGLVEPFAGNNHTERGNRLEKIAAELYTELTGNKLMRKSAAFVHPDHPFIVGHIDRVIVGEKKIAEIKCPSVAAYRKIQRDGLPESMILQLQGYLGLSGYASGEWIVFCADQMDVLNFTLEFDQGIYDAAIAACVKLWNENISQGVAPIATKDDKDKLIELAKIGGQDVTKRDDETFVNAITMLAEAKQILADGKELEELAKNSVKDAVENVTGIYEGGGFRLNFSPTKGRSSFEKDRLAAEHPEIKISDYTKAGTPGTQITIYQIGE